jgi:hypothetical protein
MLDRFFIHQINVSKFLLISLSSVVAEKRHGAMQKLFKKREKKKELKKWTSVRDI